MNHLPLCYAPKLIANEVMEIAYFDFLKQCFIDFFFFLPYFFFLSREAGLYLLENSNYFCNSLELVELVEWVKSEAKC